MGKKRKDKKRKKERRALGPTKQGDPLLFHHIENLEKKLKLAGGPDWFPFAVGVVVGGIAGIAIGTPLFLWGLF